jgi:hypothetical protein
VPAQPGRTFLIPVAHERVVKRQSAYINADIVEAAG